MNEPTPRELLAGLCRLLKSRGCNELCVMYDGAGDSGYVEGYEMKPEDIDGNELITKEEFSQHVPARDMSRSQVFYLDHTELELKNLIENIVSDYLCDVYPGWEINEGSMGKLIIDVENRKVESTNNVRITEFSTQRLTERL